MPILGEYTLGELKSAIDSVITNQTQHEAIDNVDDGVLRKTIVEDLYLKILSIGNNSLKKRVIEPLQTLVIYAERELHFCQDCYNKGTIRVNTDTISDYGSGIPVSRDGILRIDGILVNEGTIINNGLIIN